MAFTTTRVTNPSKSRKAWSAARKAPWSKAMTSRKKTKRAKKSRRTNPSSKRSSKRTTSRKYRSSNPRKRVSRRRRTNPIDWKETAIQAAGVVAGSYLGWAVTSFVGNNLIEKLPATMTGVGYLGAGFGALLGGYMLRPHAPKLPLVAFAAAASVPMWLRAFAKFNLLPAGIPSALTQTVDQAGVEVTESGMGRRRLMPRTRYPRLLTARGTMAPGNTPGLRMNGTIMPSASPGYRARSTVNMIA